MLTKQQVIDLRDEVQIGLDLIGEAVGYKLILGRAKFGETVVFKLEACPVDKRGATVTTAMADFRRLAHRYGLEATDLGREFTHSGSSYRICGLVSRNRRYPILATGSDGKSYKFSAVFVQRRLALAVAKEPPHDR